MSKDNHEAFETFEFDLPPIRGFPELRWAGKRPFKSTQYFPAQKKESYGDPTDGWWNRIYWGDNLQVMSHLLREFRGKVHLVYIDPPFDSNADYRMTVQTRGRVASSSSSSFEEKQYSDIWTNDEYLQFMYERLVILRELLREDGTICVHVDPNKSHYLKVIMDEIFGTENFRSEIIWQKLRALKAQSSHYSNMHDSILTYSKSSEFTFHPQYGDKDPRMLKTHYRHVEEESGRIYRLADFTQAGQGEPKRFGEKILPPPAGKHWIWSQDKIDEGMSNGTIVFSKNGVPNVKRYYDATEGARIGDIWPDIPPLNPMADERENYPTQKPEALLERIVRSFSNDGDIVLDTFMGSGTTQAVATRLGRRCVGADINLGAIETTIERLNKVKQTIRPQEDSTFYSGFEVYNVNNYDLFRNPVEAKELIREAMELQPLSAGSTFDGQRDGYLVKIMPVNRIATRQDLNEIINGLDYKAFERRQAEAPNKPVERIHLVCMGHEPDLGAELEKAVKPFDIDVLVTDLIRDKSHLQFKKSSDARLAVENGELVIEGFYPMNLLQKLSLEPGAVEDWRQLVESVKIDFNYDGVLTPAIVDAPEKDELVAGRYAIPPDAGAIRVKITDLISESWEGDIENA